MDKILGYILENEDLTSLNYLNMTGYDPIDQEIVQHIKDSGEFSATALSALSIQHALRYMQLCNQYAGKKIDKEVLEYLTKIQNEE